MKAKDYEFTQNKQRIEIEKQSQNVITVSLDEWLNVLHHMPDLPNVEYQNNRDIF